MRTAVKWSKTFLTVLGTWVILLLAVALPGLLPARWQYYIYSPASVGLWMIAMIVAPILVCWKLRHWIRTY
ncbi:hypothetical protein G3I76_42105 [Streptomyces sp. SID11233]|uniref:hypothetical protein n=1 Tax=unclassified Streptomyces TaxID=2593676 RepID=UPI00093CC180|nr:hypothetical protein [Streptomyces sp. NBC_00342]NED86672.1 hypothetical protein [Streptomyces sp. SID11233]OKK25054.1 hypothetical protein AMK09_02425 [Streptomyces sp. CB02488]